MSIIKLIKPIALTVPGACVMVVIQVLLSSKEYGSKRNNWAFPRESEVDYGYSFMLAWFVFIGNLCATLAFVLFSRKRKRDRAPNDELAMADEPTIIGRWAAVFPSACDLFRYVDGLLSVRGYCWEREGVLREETFPESPGGWRLDCCVESGGLVVRTTEAVIQVAEQWWHSILYTHAMWMFSLLIVKLKLTSVLLLLKLLMMEFDARRKCILVCSLTMFICYIFV